MRLPQSHKHLTCTKPYYLVTPRGEDKCVQANGKLGDASTMWTGLMCTEPHHRPPRVRCLTIWGSVTNDAPNGIKLPSAEPQWLFCFSMIRTTMPGAIVVMG